MEKMVEPPLSEGGKATITAMSALAAVGQYVSTNSAKSTFLCNTGLVVKATLSKLPHDQDMHGQNNVIVGVLGTGVPRLACLRRGSSGGLVQPSFISSSSRPS